MHRLAALLLLAATPLAAQSVPAFYAPTNVAVETSGQAEIRIVRGPGSDNGQPSTFTVKTNDFSIDATAIWPADYPTQNFSQTVTIPSGQNFAYITLPLTYHNSFQDTKVIILDIEPVTNATIDRNEVPIVVYDGDVSHMDAWIAAPGSVQSGGFAMLRHDACGYPKLDGATFPAPNYAGMYPCAVAGEVVYATGSGYTPDGTRQTWHVRKLNDISRDAWFYADDLAPVTVNVGAGNQLAMTFIGYQLSATQ